MLGRSAKVPSIWERCYAHRYLCIRLLFLLVFGTLTHIYMMCIFLYGWWLYSTTDIIIILWDVICVRSDSWHLFIFGVFMTGNVIIVIVIYLKQGYDF